MEFIELDKKYKRNKEDKLDNIAPSYLLEDSIFYVEPNFYTQLVYLKVTYVDKFEKIVDSLGEIAERNKKVIFTGNFDFPLIKDKEDFIYRDIDDVLAFNKLTIDIKINPESDWKD